MTNWINILEKRAFSHNVIVQIFATKLFLNILLWLNSKSVSVTSIKQSLLKNLFIEIFDILISNKVLSYKGHLIFGLNFFVLMAEHKMSVKIEFKSLRNLITWNVSHRML